MRSAYEITFHHFGTRKDRLTLTQERRDFAAMRETLKKMATESVYRITATCDSTPAGIDVRL